jgi:hypothetical protein
MKVGDYVRTEYGVIAKIDNIVNFEQENQKPYLNFNNMLVWTENDKNVAGSRGIIIKSSPNIIDLIEVGDYVDKLRVVDKYEKYIVAETFDERIVITKEDTIKSIVTKEQFESMEYKIGE